MPRYIIYFILLSFFACQGKRSVEHHQPEDASDKEVTPGAVERLSPALDAIIAPDASLEILGEGYDWSEGPVWVAKHDFLLFSDIPPNMINRWSADSGVTQYLKPAGYTGQLERGGEIGANGLIIDRDGHLVMCQHGDRRIARMDAPLTEPRPRYTTIADSYNGKKLNSPNDLVQHSNGDIYFTDPPYGLEKNMNDPAKELDFQGVYRVTPDGQVHLLTKELSRPNGIALSPDEKTLYVANSDGKNAVWMAYDLTSDGDIADGRVFHDATALMGKEKGAPDGMTVDRSGNILATGPGGVWVFSPAGEVLGKIRTGQATSNCTIGNDGAYLYMTADMYLMRIPLKNGNH
jgi:gluconolactonase